MKHACIFITFCPMSTCGLGHRSHGTPFCSGPFEHQPFHTCGHSPGSCRTGAAHGADRGICNMDTHMQCTQRRHVCTAHTCMHTDLHTCIQTHAQHMCAHTCTHRHIHSTHIIYTCVHMHVHCTDHEDMCVLYMCACSYTHAHGVGTCAAHLHACAYMHTYMHPHAHSADLPHAHVHAHAHARTLSFSRLRWSRESSRHAHCAANCPREWRRPPVRRLL